MSLLSDDDVQHDHELHRAVPQSWRPHDARCSHGRSSRLSNPDETQSSWRTLKLLPVVKVEPSYLLATLYTTDQGVRLVAGHHIGRKVKIHSGNS